MSSYPARIAPAPTKIAKLTYYFSSLILFFEDVSRSYFSQKTGFDISCKLSPMETICMKCQILFSETNKNIIINILSTEFVERVEKVKGLVLLVCTQISLHVCVIHTVFTAHIYNDSVFHLSFNIIKIISKWHKNSAEGVIAPAGAKVTGASIRMWLLNKFISFLAVLTWKTGLKKM